MVGSWECQARIGQDLTTEGEVRSGEDDCEEQWYQLGDTDHLYDD